MTDRPKTDDEIAREKDAVAKMKGAKDAMETVLQRCQTLERALNGTIDALETVKKAVGPGLHMPTYHHNRGGGGAATISVQEAIQYGLDIARKNL